MKFSISASVIVAYLPLLINCVSRIDKTTIPGSSGDAVVKASIRRVQDSCIFPNDNQLLRRIAWVQTHFGNDINTFANRYDGIWRMQVSDYTKTLNATNYASGEWARIMSEVQSRLKQDYRNFGYEQGPPNEAMIVPLEAAIATRMYFYMGQQCTTQTNGHFDCVQKHFPMTVEEQAQLWASSYAGANGMTAQFISAVNSMPGDCRSPGADILFILDSSGSIGQTNWDLMVDFVHEVVNSFSISNDGYKFGVDYFSDSARTFVKFNDYGNDKATLLAKILQLKSNYMSQGTNTHLALRRAYSTSFTTAYGVRDPSSGYPRVVVLLTDGQSNTPSETQKAADEARQHGLVLFTIGIGSSVDSDELIGIASQPKCSHVYYLQDFNSLAKGFPIELKSQTCQSSSVTHSTDTNTTVFNNTLDLGQYQFYQFTASDTAGITFVVQVGSGNVTFYVSTLYIQPDEVQYDYSISVGAGDFGQIYLDSATLQGGKSENSWAPIMAESRDNTVVYLSLRGNAPGKQNSFVMTASPGNQLLSTTTVTSTTTTTTTATTTTTTSGAVGKFVISLASIALGLLVTL